MSSRRSSSGAAFLVPFGLLFICAGLGVGIFYAGLLKQWFSARSWIETPCVIESSTLRDHLEKKAGSQTSRDTLMNETMATYRYEFGSQSYIGHEVSISLGADNFGDFQERAAEVLLEYQNSGKPFRCYVNPHHPEEAILFREARWTILLFMGIFPLVFPLVGGAVSIGGLLAMQEKQRLRSYKSRFPGEPWRWTRDWSGDWIPPQNAGRFWAWVVVAIWGTIIWLPMFIALFIESDVSPANPVSLVVFLPLAIWLFIIWITAKQLLQRKNGLLHLHVEPRPVVPGSALEAWVAIPPRFPLGIHVQIQAELRCVKEVTTYDSKSSITSRETLWSGQDSSPISEATREAQGSRLPIHIDIPAGLPAPLATPDGTDEDGAMRHGWELELRATGLRNPVVFDVPVFHTQETLAEETAKTVSKTSSPRTTSHPLDLDADELTMHLVKHHITAVFDPQERPVSFDLSAKRMRGVRLFLIPFNIVWTAVFIGMLFADEIPLLFPVVWGASSLLIWWLVILMFQNKQVHFSDSGMEIYTQLGPWNNRQSFERRQLLEFTHRTNMTSGNTRYYQVRAEATYGKKVTVLDGITNELVVENLCRLLESWRKQA